VERESFSFIANGALCANAAGCLFLFHTHIVTAFPAVPEFAGLVSEA
jgi:hypothetical protein